MASTTEVTTAAQSKSKGPKLLKAGSAEFVSGLAERNVRFRPEVDQDGGWLKDAIIPKSSQTCSAKDESNWKVDLLKCKVSDEAIFQRTIMMELIDRHRLKDTLDYTCESKWTSQSTIPQRTSSLASRMPKPTPDLAVAFKAETILSDFKQNDLRIDRSVMCPESSKQVKRDRAFHFLSFEVKGASGEVENWTANEQNLNTATLALHNMYFFMRMAGEKELQDFYAKVRFFSVVATTKAFHVRVHRAIKIDEAEGRIEDDYPLGFVYDVLYSHEGGTYTRATAAGIVQNILTKYAVKILHPILKKAMDKAWPLYRAGLRQNGPRADSQLHSRLQQEAETHRHRERAQSRRSHEPSATAQPSRKLPSLPAQDTSFARKGVDNLSVGGSSSSAFESRPTS
jgi:hypothetical protein